MFAIYLAVTDLYCKVLRFELIFMLKHHRQTNMQYMSDLHLQNARWIPRMSSPVLALVGDIFELRVPSVWKPFLLRTCPRFQQVYFVYGNHEFYGVSDVAKEKRKFTKWCKTHVPNLTVLDNSWVWDPTLRVNVVGTTLWSHVPPFATDYVQQHINDYHSIREKGKLVRVTTTNRWHQTANAFLDTVPQDVPFVVLTHHAPLLKGCSDPMYEDLPTNFAFASDQSARFKSPMVAWIFGHTHYRVNKCINNVQLRSNPCGYPHEATGFDPRSKIDIIDSELLSRNLD